MFDVLALRHRVLRDQIVTNEFTTGWCNEGHMSDHDRL